MSRTIGIRSNTFRELLKLWKFAMKLGVAMTPSDAAYIIRQHDYYFGSLNQVSKNNFASDYLDADKTDDMEDSEREIIAAYYDLELTPELRKAAPKTPVVSLPSAQGATTTNQLTTPTYGLGIVENGRLTNALVSMITQMSQPSFVFDNSHPVVTVCTIGSTALMLVGNMVGPASFGVYVNGYPTMGHPDRVTDLKGEQRVEFIRRPHGAFYARPIYLKQETTPICRKLHKHQDKYWAIRKNGAFFGITLQEYIALLPKDSKHYLELTADIVAIG